MFFTCAVPGCNSRKYKYSQDYSFHQLPSNPYIREIWLRKLGRQNWIPNQQITVCSKHFDASCFSEMGAHGRILQIGSFPTKFMPATSTSNLIPQTEERVNKPQSNETNTLPESKAIIISVYTFLEKQLEDLKKVVNNNAYIIGVASNILKRTAEATGVSEKTIVSILEEKRNTDSDCQIIETEVKDVPAPPNFNRPKVNAPNQLTHNMSFTPYHRSRKRRLQEIETNGDKENIPENMSQMSLEQQEYPDLCTLENVELCTETGAGCPTANKVPQNESIDDDNTNWGPNYRNENQIRRRKNKRKNSGRSLNQNVTQVMEKPSTSTNRIGRANAKARTSSLQNNQQGPNYRNENQIRRRKNKRKNSGRSLNQNVTQVMEKPSTSTNRIDIANANCRTSSLQNNQQKQGQDHLEEAILKMEVKLEKEESMCAGKAIKAEPLGLQSEQNNTIAQQRDVKVKIEPHDEYQQQQQTSIPVQGPPNISQTRIKVEVFDEEMGA